MSDLAIALRLLERKDADVLSRVTLIYQPIWWAGETCVPEVWGQPFEVHMTTGTNVTLPGITLVHELKHVAQLERGQRWRSGEWAEQWLQDTADDETYRTRLRRYFTRFHQEREALRLGLDLAGNAEWREVYEALLGEHV